MKIMFHFCITFLFCFLLISIQDIHATTKEEMPYEINQITATSNGFELSGWGIITNNQHFLDASTHSYRIILTSNQEQLFFKANMQAQNQSELMQVLGTRKCGLNEYGQVSNTCWYDYINVGFKTLIPYQQLKMDQEYTVSLEITAKKTNTVKRINLYYPTELPMTHINDIYEYRAISSLEDTSLIVSYFDVFVRPKPAIKKSFYRTRNVCSVSYGNLLYFKSNTLYNNIYEKQLIKGTTYYRLAGNEADCERNHRVIKEGSHITPAWIASSFVDYNGKPLTIKTFLNNQPPALKISQNPTITLDNVALFNPFQYVSAYDKEDGDLTDKIVKISGQVIETVGSYELIFKVSDKNGLSDQKSMIVNVKENPNTPPWIEAYDKIIHQYVPFDYLKDIIGGDKEDGDLSHRITYTGEVDVEKLGDYQVHYQVKDSKHMVADKTINIKVIKNPREIIRYIDKNYPWYKEKIPVNWKKKYDKLLDQLEKERTILTLDIDS
ncbi:MAG: DUF5011 domain-containing protein [Erysipelotrichaceae bacterium]